MDGSWDKVGVTLGARDGLSEGETLGLEDGCDDGASLGDTLLVGPWLGIIDGS